MALVRALRFRFGFIVQREGDLRAELLDELRRADWRSTTVAAFQIWTHPETRLDIRQSDGSSIVLMGEVYSETSDGNAVALPDRFDASDTDFLHGLLDDLGGRFALIAIRGSRMRVCHDPIGSRSVYYHVRHPLGVSSHAALLAMAVGAEKCPEISSYMENEAYCSRAVKYLPGDRTTYRDLLALPPNMWFDSESMAITRHWPLKRNSPVDLADFNATAISSLTAFSRHLKKNHVPVLGLTGGVDSRLALAMFLKEGLPLETITWNRASLLPGEAKTVDALVSDLGLRHEYLVEPAQAGQIGKLAALNAGGAFMRHPRLSAALRKRYGRSRGRVLIRAWGGEVVRVFYARRLRPMTSLDADEMSRVYLGEQRRGRGRSSPVDPEHQRRTEAYFAEFAARCGHADVDRLGYDPNDIFYLEHRMGMWAAAANNEVDVALFGMVPFNSRRLFAAAFGLTRKQRSDKAIFLNLIAGFSPACARIPITKPSRSLHNMLRTCAIWIIRTAKGYGR